jgi:SAM-dependent methyltransferase
VRQFYDSVAIGAGPYTETVDKFSPSGPTDRIVALARESSATRILDLGSGMGTTLMRLLREHQQGMKYYGVDFSPKMIARARERVAELPEVQRRKIKFFHVDAQSIPFMDGDFDFIYSECVLNLLSNRTKTIAEVARLLAPGGLFVYTDFVASTAVPDAIRQNEQLACGCRSGSVTLAENIAQLERAGFVGIEYVDFTDDKNRRDAELLASNPAIRREEEDLQTHFPDVAAFLNQQVGYYLFIAAKPERTRS